jgi:nitroreductase
MDGMSSDDPWAVDPAAFRACDTPAARLRFLLTYAVLAPSSHNTQPWRFHLREGARLELRADRTRALPVVDPEERALIISCGAALANLRAAGAALGEALEVATMPDPADRELLAVIHAGGPCAPAPGSARLLRAMTARRSSRFAYSPDPVPAPLRAEIIAAAEAEGTARLHWVEDFSTRHAIALLVAEGDHLQMADPAFRHELAMWLRASHRASRDGVSGAAFGLPDMLSFALALAIRTFDLGGSQAAKDLALAEGSPVLAVIATPGETQADWLAAGEALQRVLLAVTAGGFTASFMNQPIEVPALRGKLAEAVGAKGLPQLLIRIGRGPKPVPAMRRPVRDVLREA